MDTRIHIAVAFDQNYLNQFYALSTSLFFNNKSCTIHLHTIATGITEVERSAIVAYVKKHGADISFYIIDQVQVSKFVLTNQWTSAVYYRLFFPLLVPTTVSRLLYLDSDTVAVGDVSELYAVNLDGYPVGCVYDNYVKHQPLIGISEGEYFNSGVLVIDIERWKFLRISERAIDYLQKFPERILYVDQCARLTQCWWVIGKGLTKSITFYTHTYPLHSVKEI
jgi:lipopolysaccharide biosynthesis glycosyltransferase